MIVVSMNKRDLGTYGEAYFLTLGNIEDPSKKSVQISINEYEAKQLMPMFSNHKITGKFNEHEEWIK